MNEAAKPDRQHERSQARGTQSSPEEPPEEVRYSIEELTDHAQSLLGVSTHAVAGALVGERRKSLTLDEAKDAVNAFLGHEEERDPATVEAGS